MRIKGITPNFNTYSPGPGTYKNEKMGLYKHYPSWKIGTGKRDEDLRRIIKEGFPSPGKYGFEALKDFFLLNTNLEIEKDYLVIILILQDLVTAFDWC